MLQEESRRTTWKAIERDATTGIFDSLYGVGSSSLTSSLARDKKNGGQDNLLLKPRAAKLGGFLSMLRQTPPLFL